MDDRGDNPRWVAALVTALPLLLAAALVWYFPPGPRPTGGRPERTPAPAVTGTTEAEPELHARAR